MPPCHSIELIEVSCTLNQAVVLGRGLYISCIGSNQITYLSNRKVISDLSKFNYRERITMLKLRFRLHTNHEN